MMDILGPRWIQENTETLLGTRHFDTLSIRCFRVAVGEAGSVVVEEAGSVAVGEAGSVVVEEAGSVAVGEAGSVAVGEAGSVAVGEAGSVAPRPPTRARLDESVVRGPSPAT